jgi:DNA modification methylase
MKNQIVNIAPTLLIENKFVSELYSVTENYETIKSNIELMGVLEPLIVDENNVVISGNLRRQIAIELGIPTVPVIIKENAGLDINSNKLNTLSHAQQRIKTYSQLLKEHELLCELFPTTKGERTDLDPVKKQNKKVKEQLPISKGKISKLKKIKLLAKEVYAQDENENQLLWKALDEGQKTIHGTLTYLQGKIQKQVNSVIVPAAYDLITDAIKIYNKTCRELVEIMDKTIACVSTSVPYFQMKDYGTGSAQRGLEKDVNDYINNLVIDFRDTKRVLKDDGSLWVNINDCVIDGAYQAVPHRFLIAMINDGWILNDEITWIKKNTQYTRGDRSLRAHEYIFHFVKSKNFYYNAEWLKDVQDENNNVSCGTTQKHPKLLSSFDFRESVLKTNAANTSELRTKLLLKKGVHLTHSATFPLSVPMICILSSSRPGDTILDGYSGTSSTGEVALMFGRKYVGYELNPEYIMASEVRLAEYLDNDDSNLLAA